MTTMMASGQYTGHSDDGMKAGGVLIGVGGDRGGRDERDEGWVFVARGER